MGLETGLGLGMGFGLGLGFGYGLRLGAGEKVLDAVRQPECTGSRYL